MIIGMIGLGLMGGAMSSRLLSAGHHVRGYDLSAEACENARNLGVTVLPDACAVALEAEILILSLMTSANRRDLLWGSQHLAAAVGPRHIILDTTTARPEDIETDSERLRSERGSRLVDVCVSGSSQVVAEGRAIALVGDTEAQAGYVELLRTFSTRIYFFGQPGKGNRAKLVVNLVFGLNRLVLAEALGLAKRAGFDLATMLDVLKEGETYSTAMDTKGPKMISGQYEPAVARLAQHAKDVKLILAMAKSVGARTPLSAVHELIIDETVAAGFGELDNAAIFKAFE